MPHMCEFDDSRLGEWPLSTQKQTSVKFRLEYQLIFPSVRLVKKWYWPRLRTPLVESGKKGAQMRQLITFVVAFCLPLAVIAADDDAHLRALCG